MTETQPIRQLPELEDHQEWACDGGCSNIVPKRMFEALNNYFKSLTIK